jgi:hypothetical protein
MQLKVIAKRMKALDKVINKLVFLDMDGVVVSNKTNDQAICAWYGTSTVEEAYKLREIRKKGGLYVPKFMGTNSSFDPAAVKYLNTLANMGVQFVVTSTWRETQTIQSLSDIFEMKGLHIPIYSFTNVDSHERGQQILNWLERAEARNTTAWCVVDDESYGIANHVGDKLVLTNPDIGLNEEAYQRICEILEQQEP